MTRREFLANSLVAGTALAGAGSLGALLAACSPGGDGGVQEMTIGFDGGSWQEFLDQEVTQPFIKKMGGKVKILYDIGTESDRLTKLAAQKNNPLVALSKLSTTNIDHAVEIGVCDKIDVSAVPNLRDVHPAFKNDYWTSQIVATFGVTYNTQKITKPITSWFDLWDPAYKGKVGMPVFEWMGQQFLQVINLIAGGTPEKFDSGVKKLKEYVKTMNPVFISATDHGIQLFTQGEIWIAPFWDGRTRQLQASNVPVKFVFPKEGACPLGYGLALTQGKPRDLALKYLDFSLDPAVQIAYARKTNYPPVNQKALDKLPADLEGLRLKKEDMDNMLKIDYLASERMVDKYLDAWNKEIVGG
jgi:putative spermidine/putrescine transport system substrate-binding protein